jgi:hypothetical protein
MTIAAILRQNDSRRGLDNLSDLVFIIPRQNMKSNFTICLRDQRVNGRTSMWHRAAGIVGGTF